MSPKSNQPHQPLGNKLKSLREKVRESLAEVSGALEIDIDLLEKIEHGEQLPSEDVLMLLISHFSMKDEDATKLWELAGYDKATTTPSSVELFGDKSSVMVMPTDARIVYTDMVHVMVNNYGVVMNFMQGAGPNNQPLAVARVGMSHEHAKSVLEVLRQTLEQHQLNNRLPHEHDKPQNS